MKFFFKKNTKSSLNRIIIFLLLGVPILVSAQQGFNTFETKNLLIKTKMWTMENGLPHWNMKGVFKDSRGFVWMLNKNYLTYFDGKTFTVVDTVEMDGYQALDPAFLGEDLNHNIWSLRTGELHISNPSTSQTFSVEKYTGMKSPAVAGYFSHLFCADQVIYLFSNKEQKLWRYNGQFELLFSSEMSNPETQLRYCLPGPNNTFWGYSLKKSILLLGHNGTLLQEFTTQDQNKLLFLVQKQLYRLPVNTEGSSFLHPQALLSGSRNERSEQIDEIIPALKDDEFPLINTLFRGMKYFGSSPTFDCSTTAGFSTELSLELSTLFQTKMKYSWRRNFDESPVFVGNDVLFIPVSGKGLLQIKILPKRFHIAARDVSVRSIKWVDENRLWIANAAEQQLLEYDQRMQKSSSNKKYSDLWTCLSGNKKIWLGSSGSSYPQANIMQNEDYTYPHDRLAPYSIQTYNKTIWLGSRFDQIYQVNKQYKTIKTYSSKYADNQKGHIIYPRPQILYPVSDSMMMYGNNHGVGKLNLKTGEISIILKSPPVRSIHLDRKGDFWAGTRKGLYHVSSGKVYLGAVKYLEHIYEDPDGIFWISTFKGLISWKPFSTQYEIYDKDDGLISSEIHAAYPDTLGRLWLSSNHGIMAFDTATQTVVNYTQADGLYENEQNYLAHTRGPDGRLYFGGVKGITIFNPNAFPKMPYQELPEIYISNVNKLNNEGEELSRFQASKHRKTAIAIEKNCIQVILQLSTPYYQDKKLSYSWRIDGVAPQWTKFDITQGITLSGVPQGSFNVEIKTSDSRDKNNFRISHFPFLKHSYLHEQLWFQGLALTLGIVFMILMSFLRNKALTARNRKLRKIIESRTRKITVQNQQLERLDHTKNLLFNNLSHEFRTPLSIIKGHNDQLMMNKSGFPESKDSLNQIDIQVNRLSSMMSDLMDLSKLKMGEIKVHSEPIAWNVFLDRIFAMFDGLARSKHIDYKLESLTPEDLYLSIDPAKTERILSNLLCNALKFTPDVGRILVRSEVKEGVLEIVVSDTGPGILTEEQESIFERYQQGEAAQDAGNSGYGIGLALCKEYAHLLGGRIWVESILGKGSSFFFQIPASVVAPENMPLNTASSILKKTCEDIPRTLNNLMGDEKMRHLLIVEDHPALLMFLEKSLQAEYRLSTATDGKKAWEILENDPSIDLIISDAMMPFIDGFTLLQKARSNPKMGPIPFIMLTALTEEENSLKALRLGVDRFLTKPFNISELKSHISNIIAQLKAREGFVALPSTAPDIDTPPEPIQKESLTLKEHLTSFDEAWLIELENIVKENLHIAHFKVPELAGMMHISEKTLYNRLKAYAATSPSEYLRTVRLEQAMIHIKNRKYKTIREVSYAVGMKNPKYFTDAFKKQYGKSPSEFQGLLNLKASPEPQDFQSGG